jgi:hypothetical protein
MLIMTIKSLCFLLMDVVNRREERYLGRRWSFVRMTRLIAIQICTLILPTIDLTPYRFVAIHDFHFFIIHIVIISVVFVSALACILPAAFCRIKHLTPQKRPWT